MANINGYEYGWVDVQVVIEGSPLVVRGITGFSYGPKRAHENVYGAGSKPVAKSRGKKEFAGKITLLQSEAEALQAALPVGFDLTDMDVNITVSYAPTGGTIVTDQLVGCRFPDYSKEMDTDTMNMEVSLSLIPFDILMNI